MKCKFCQEEIKEGKEYCNRTCFNNHRKELYYKIVKCLNCTNTIQIKKTNNHTKFCCNNCKKEFANKQYKHKKICKNCSREFELYKSETLIFCCHACRCEYDRKQFREDRICKKCGNTFNTFKSSDQEFCTHECYIEYIKEITKIKYDTEFSNCLLCGEKIRLNEKFCCKAHKEKYYSQKSREIRICECGREFEVYKKDSKFLCSDECQKKYILKPEVLDKIKEKRAITSNFNNYNARIDKIKSLNLFDFDCSEEEYKSNKNIKLKCKKCGYEFEEKINLNHLPSCIKCNPIPYILSKPEEELSDYIHSIINKNIIENKRTIIRPLELDFYLPDYNLAIEFDGCYWHSEIHGHKDKKYHINKTKMCESQGIQLIHIFDDEWTNKKEIIKNTIKHKLNLNNTDKIYARKCIIKEINSKTKNTFLNNNHIQGEDKSKIKLGLFYNDELVAVMTFGKLRLALGNKTSNINEYELIRFATSKTIIGGFSKLLSYFIKTYNPIKITTYADKRWSNGNVYIKNGFNLIHETQPNYWYMKNYSIREHRFKYRKSELPKLLTNYNSELTEWDNMQLNGYDRIWDCGSLKFEMNISQLNTSDKNNINKLFEF
jgi:very-short-patch-repair endonuclease